MPDTHGDLAAALKSWRARMSPRDVGLPAAAGRRAVGLRREELAALAGLSVDYVVRLEQGRARNPSDQVVASLARALQLREAERDHLYRIAGLLAPLPGTVSTHIPPSVQRLVARLGESPIAVFSASWTLLTWSPLWAALIGDPEALSRRDRNLLRSHFLGGGLAATHGHSVRPALGSRHFEESLVADLRRVEGRYPEDPATAELIDDLVRGSELFRELWESGAVGEHQSELKTLEHPIVGDLTLDCDVLSVAGTDLRIVVYTAATGTPDSEKLDFLRVSALASLADG